MLAVLSLLLGGCSLASGLYIDRMQGEDELAPESEGAQLSLSGASQSSGTEALGGAVEIISITADLVRTLKEEHILRLQAKRDLSHKLFLENQELKGRYAYRVGPTDVLTIVAWGHPELNIDTSENKQQGAVTQESGAPVKGTGHEVDFNGYIFYPYIGLTNVAGKTLAEVRTQITRELTRYIPNPQIDVGVSQFRNQRAYVVGQVDSPRTIPITQVPLEIIDTITQANGLLDSADTRNAILTRDGEKFHVDLQAILDGDITQNYILRDGDVLAVPDNHFNGVFLLGEFDKTVGIPISRAEFFSLADAIGNQAIGGFSPDVDSSRIFVFRYRENNPDSNNFRFPEVYHLNAESAEAMLLAANFPLLPRDVIYAAPTGLTRWNRVVEKVLPTIQAITEPIRAYWYLDGILQVEPANR